MKRRLLVSLAVAASAFATVPAQAAALSCAGGNPASITDYADIFFEGVVQEDPGGDGYAPLRVTRYLTGSGPSRQTAGTGWGFFARKGETWTIFGRIQADGKVEAGLCDPSHRGRASRPEPRPVGFEPGRSIAGAALGIGYESALQLLGANHRSERYPTREQWWQWTFLTRRLRVVFSEPGRVWGLSTSSARYRTSDDIGVGSSEHRLELRYPEVRCRPVGSSTRSCVLAGDRGRTTDFRVRDKLIYKITVALPPASPN